MIHLEEEICRQRKEQVEIFIWYVRRTEAIGTGRF
jgi:hypothetical protein